MCNKHPNQMCNRQSNCAEAETSKFSSARWRLFDVVLHLKEGGGLGDDAPDPDLRLQRKRDGLDVWEVHLVVVSQEGLQPLRLQKRTGHNSVGARSWHRFSLFLRSSLVLTFFLRFPLSRCTAFISCTSLSTKVCWAASSERITLTLLSPWTEIGREVRVLCRHSSSFYWRYFFICIRICEKRKRQVAEPSAEPGWTSSWRSGTSRGSLGLFVECPDPHTPQSHTWWQIETQTSLNRGKTQFLFFLSWVLEITLTSTNSLQV